MGILSKIAVPVLLLDATDALQKKKAGRAGKFLGAFLGASSSHGAPLSEHEVQTKWHTSQDELTGLLADNTKMQGRFENFMQGKYGDVCKNDGMGSKTCNPYQLQDEKDPKYLAFQHNVQMAHMRNSKQSDPSKVKTVVHGITSVSDLTRAEQWGLLGYKASQIRDKNAFPDYEFGCDETAEGCKENGAKDWRDDGFVTPVKDQGQCGSCWAFSTVQSVESQALAQGLYTKDSPYIGSPQEVVSCDHNGDQGCHGGLPEQAFAWLQDQALEEESKYPYKSGVSQQSGHCMKKHKGPGHLNVDTVHTVGNSGKGETTKMKKYILNNGPMSVAVAANDNWFTYSGGVMDIDDCPAGNLDHAVQAVALDTDKKVWTIRNSWNTGWGEEGFIRITYGKNTCNVAGDSHVITVKKSDEDVTMTV